MNEIHALSGAYAVDALDDVERTRFERHLAGCSDCQAEVASLREAAAALADDAATAPPPQLRDRVLSQITAVRPLPPAAPPERTSGSRRWLPALVAAAVLAVLGIGAAVWQPWQQESAPTLTATEQVLQAEDATQETLTFPDGASATLVRSESEHRAVLVTEAMPAAPNGKVYQLWLQMPDEGMVSAGVMPARADQTVLLEGDATDATAAGITVEPAGGSTEPTSDPIALFDFAELEQSA